VLRVGDKAPPFESIDHRGRTLRLGSLLAEGPVVLFFYPRDFTPICTREVCHFRDAYEDLRRFGVSIVGVSPDDAISHESFAVKHGLTYSLLSDPNLTLARDYGAGRLLGLGLKRITYVIDREGIVRGAFHHELRAKRHVEEVLALLQSLTGSRAGASPS
jgi:thioredoxin-dependent peroxiredoxin